MEGRMTQLEDLLFDTLVLEAYQKDFYVLHNRALAKILHSIPFYWTDISDSNRAGDANSYRAWDFATIHNIHYVTPQDLIWVDSAPSVFEVLMGMARRLTFMFSDFPHVYYQEMVRNLFEGRTFGAYISPVEETEIRVVVDRWLARQFESNGRGSPFPINQLDIQDQRTISLWDQMHAYSWEHYQ